MGTGLARTPAHARLSVADVCIVPMLALNRNKAELVVKVAGSDISAGAK